MERNKDRKGEKLGGGGINNAVMSEVLEAENVYSADLCHVARVAGQRVTTCAGFNPYTYIASM
jgi:hypothetical protein